MRLKEKRQRKMEGHEETVTDTVSLSFSLLNSETDGVGYKEEGGRKTVVNENEKEIDKAEENTQKERRQEERKKKE